jgi:pyridoxamine 5'-phosphate oxidase
MRIIQLVASFAQRLREVDVDPDPLRQFDVWFGEAREAGVRAPEAAALATASSAAVPSVRMVLVKRFDASGFVFYSNYESRKGEELATNPHAALLFYWDPLGRQVRIEGPVQRTSTRESEAYVRSRPRASQLSALASPQSRPVESREMLEQRVADLAAQYDSGDLPTPEAWGGFRIRPLSFEFWQHRDDRLHDRLVYTPKGDRGWRIERLAP